MATISLYLPSKNIVSDAELSFLLLFILDSPLAIFPFRFHSMTLQFRHAYSISSTRCARGFRPPLFLIEQPFNLSTSQCTIYSFCQRYCHLNWNPPVFNDVCFHPSSPSIFSSFTSKLSILINILEYFQIEEPSSLDICLLNPLIILIEWRKIRSFHSFWLSLIVSSSLLWKITNECEIFFAKSNEFWYWCFREWYHWIAI